MQATAPESPPRRKGNISLLNSIGLRLFLSVLGGSLLGLGCASYLFYQKLAKQAQAELVARMDVKAETLEGSFNSFENSARLVANSATTLYEAGERREQVYVSLIRRSLEGLPLATGLGFGQPPASRLIIPSRKYAYPWAIRSSDGKITAKGGDSDPNNFQENYFLKPIKLQRGLWLEPVRYEETTVTPPRVMVTTSYSLPFYNSKKQLLGVLGQDVELGFLSEKLSEPVVQEQDLARENRGYFILVSAEGNLIAYPPDPQYALDLKPFFKISNYAELWDQIQTNLKAKSQNTGILSWKDGENRKEFWAYRRIPNTNWVLLASVPESVIYGPLLRLTASGTLLAAFFASAVLLVVVIRFVQSLNQRLQPIMDECNRLAETSAKGEELMGREDELGRLTISFYNLLGQVTVNEKRLRKEMGRSEKALQALQQTQAQLIQTEKMSGLGQLVAGVAHEINNPINFIYGNLPHATSYTQDLLNLIELYDRKYPDPDPEIQDLKEDIDLDFLVNDLQKMLASMRIGADRIREIVLSLRNFSRLDEAEMKYVNIHEGIDSTLLILQNRLKPAASHRGIEVVKEYGTLPPVECYAGQLNQVFMNILGNAIDALEKYYGNSEAETPNGQAIEPDPTPKDPAALTQAPAQHGLITIKTEVLSDEANVVIRIRDNGAGISADHQRRLFDPFFTTKPVGQGTGLGLSISYQIVVEKHHGVLKCISEPGEGAEFWIQIPISQYEPSAQMFEQPTT